MNLAGNSLEFTKAGKVEISVEARGDLLVYKVADTGIGIPPDKLDTVFAEFKQTDATIASEYGGTGLGLSISRKFIEMHGGRIWGRASPAVARPSYSRFRCASAPGPRHERKDHSLRRGQRDEPQNRARPAQAHDVPADRGSWTAKQARGGAGNKRPDLILMDIQLPKISGMEAMRRLRAEMATANTPIIAITSFALERRRAEGEGSRGATAYLAKPYSSSSRPSKENIIRKKSLRRSNRRRRVKS